MFGGQTAMEGGSPWDIVASSITGGVMGATSGAKPEAAPKRRVSQWAHPVRSRTCRRLRLPACSSLRRIQRSARLSWLRPEIEDSMLQPKRRAR